MKILAAFLVGIFGILMGSVTSGQTSSGTSELKEFLYRIQPTRPAMLRSGPTPQESAAVEAHFLYLKELTAKGVVILAGRTLNNDESTFGIVIFRAASEDAAQGIMNSDPAVKGGVMRAALFPFKVVLINPGKQE